MSTFKRTIVASLPAYSEPQTDAEKFWKNNIQPATVFKELKAINWVDIDAENVVLATSTNKVFIYDQSFIKSKKSFTAPNLTNIYCASFRKNTSKIFAAGCGDGVVRIWDTKKGKPLRSFGADERISGGKHSAAVHRVNFNGLDQLFSCGDDRKVHLWEITSEKLIESFGEDGEAHSDYIRASHFHSSGSFFVSGGYDHMVKIWDHRQPKQCAHSFDLGAPVESITGHNFQVIGSGGTNIKIFDLVAGKVLKTLNNVHHKTITCVHSQSNYLLTASIDGHLKIYDQNYQVANCLSYVPSQILSCHFNGSLLAVGTNDGILSLRKVEKTKKEPTSSKASTNKKLRTKSDLEDDPYQVLFDNVPMKKRLKLGQTFVVNATTKHRYGDKHEELLKKFKYSSALLCAMRLYSHREPEKVVSCMQELIRQSALKTSLAGIPDQKLVKIIAFLVKNFSDPRFTRVLLDVCNALATVYADKVNRSAQLETAFTNLNKCIGNELSCLQKMTEISGQIGLLIKSQI